jgi:hypothetical protein
MENKICPIMSIGIQRNTDNPVECYKEKCALLVQQYNKGYCGLVNG